MRNPLVPYLHQSLRECAVKESSFLLEEAARFLDKENGEKYSAHNPELVIRLAHLYAQEIIAEVLLMQYFQTATGGQ